MNNLEERYIEIDQEIEELFKNHEKVCVYTRGEGSKIFYFQTFDTRKFHDHESLINILPNDDYYYRTKLNGKFRYIPFSVKKHIEPQTQLGLVSEQKKQNVKQKNLASTIAQILSQSQQQIMTQVGSQLNELTKAVQVLAQHQSNLQLQNHPVTPYANQINYEQFKMMADMVKDMIKPYLQPPKDSMQQMLESIKMVKTLFNTSKSVPLFGISDPDDDFEDDDSEESSTMDDIQKIVSMVQGFTGGGNNNNLNNNINNLELQNQNQGNNDMIQSLIMSDPKTHSMFEELKNESNTIEFDISKWSHIIKTEYPVLVHLIKSKNTLFYKTLESIFKQPIQIENIHQLVEKIFHD